MEKHEKRFTYIGILLDELEEKKLSPMWSMTSLVDTSITIGKRFIELNIHEFATRITFFDVVTDDTLSPFNPYCRKLEQVIIKHSEHGSRNKILATVDKFIKEAEMTQELPEVLEKPTPIEPPAQEEEDWMAGAVCDAATHEECESCQ